MGKESMVTAMKGAISEVMERMFYQMVQICEGHLPLEERFFQEQGLLGATLAFYGPLKGSFHLIMPVVVADKITADFLGLQREEIPEEQRIDTVKEALNMIGGSTLSGFDDKAAFRLGIPEIMDEQALRDRKFGEVKGDFFLIETEDSHLAAGIVLDRDP